MSLSQFLLANLSLGALYEVRVRAAARSRLRPAELRTSAASLSRRAMARQRCPPPGATDWHADAPGHQAGPHGVGVIAGCVCAGLALLLGLLALLLWR